MEFTDGVEVEAASKMPSEKKNPSQRLKTQDKGIRKSRVGFTIEKDLVLLKAAVSMNPWQMGEGVWNDIVDDLNSKPGFEVTKRTCKNRVELLLNKLKKEELSSKTGTEEEITERGSLLNEILAFVEESKSSINSFSTAEVEDASCSNQDEPVESEAFAKSKKSARKEEINQANSEREQLLESFAPEPNSTRRKRGRINFEEELIMNKQQHDMNVDKEKLKLERDRHELEVMREHRLAEENKRRDDLAQSQLEVQKQLLAIMTSFVNK